jgi:aminopeptidase YwaD
MLRIFLFSVFFGSTFVLSAQDTLYARKVIRKLTSKEAFGRGYTKGGLDHAARFICSELTAANTNPLFPTGYYQYFDFSVNTFPSKMKVKVNGKLLKPGMDYIVNPENGSFKGKYQLNRKDSLTYVSENAPCPLIIHLKKKLTFSVATQSAAICMIDVLRGNVSEPITSAEVHIKSKLLKNFSSRNIGAFINGTRSNDSMVVFAAHYDHLGGMGNRTYFPGANDNASGVSVLLNLVKYYEKNPPGIKTVFLFFAGEEAGLLGSKFFVENKSLDFEKIKFLINLDLLGTGEEGIMVVNGAIHSKEYDLLNKINEKKKLVKEIKKRGKARNSDHYWFSEIGVPAFFIYTLGGPSAYHDVHDVADKLPLSDYVDVFKLITEFVGHL